ncbi:MAG: Ypar14, superfamily integron cassette [Pseudomonadota bacterium]
MLAWDESDVLICLETLPDIEADGIWYRYKVDKNGIRLDLTIYPYDADIYLELYHKDIESSVFSMKLLECSGVRYVKERSFEYLEFAPAKCFGSRYDGESLIPYGVRVYANPSIRIELY